MAIKTRKVTQYQIYTLVNVTRDKKNNKNNGIERRELVAIFDDIVKLKAFMKSEELKEAEYMEEWVEISPAASNYSLPFNPKAGEVDFIPAKTNKK